MSAELTEERKSHILVRLATVQRRIAFVQDSDLDENSLHNLAIAQANLEQAVRILETGSPCRPPERPRTL